MASRNKGRKTSSRKKRLLLHPCRNVIKVKETWGNKSFELWYSFLYSWWKETMKGQTILILLPEVSHSSCCQCYSVVYLAKARLHQFMAIASKKELKGGVDAFVHFHFPFPWNADSLKAKPHAQVRLLLTKQKLWKLQMWEGVQFHCFYIQNFTGEWVTSLSYSFLLQSHCILCYPGWHPSLPLYLPPILLTTLEKI